MTTELSPADSVEAGVSALQDKLFGAVEPEQPERAEAPEPDEQEQQDEQDGQEAAAEAPTEFVEIETEDGQKFRVPPQLKNEFMHKADYTRKTQEVAAQREQAAKTLEAIQISQQFEQATATERQELARVQAELDRYKDVSWSTLDVETIVKLRQQQDALKERANELVNGLQSKGQQFQQWQAQHKAQLTQAGQQYLKTVIPAWGPAAVNDASAQARALGYTEAEVANTFDARFVHAMWKAAQYDKLQSGKGAALAKVQNAPPVIKPGPSAVKTAQGEHMNFKKALKAAPTDSRKAEVIGARLAAKFRF